MAKIGVFICWCGENIARNVDVEQAAAIVGELPGVELKRFRRSGRRAEAAASPARMPAQVVVRPVTAGAFQHARSDGLSGSRATLDRTTPDAKQSAAAARA